MKLARPSRGHGPRISLVAMVDVLMIMLVFFMVTSTYLDLDMVPLGGAGEGIGSAPGAASAETPRLLVRIDAEGRPLVRGRPLSGGDLGALVAGERARNPALEVLVLPSGNADVQALASTMDALVAGGATRLRVVRLEAQP